MPLRELPEPTGPLAERITKDGRRRLQLNKREKQDIVEQQKLNHLVSMVLTLDENSLTYQEMAEELEMTVPEMKNLMRTQAFQDTYNEYFMQLGHDPRVEYIQSRIVELLPYVFVQMQTALTSDDVPWTARWQIMDKVLELSGIERPSNVQNDRKEIEKFLSDRSSSDDNIQITIPGKYMEAMQKYREGKDIVEDNVIDGEFSEEEVSED